MVVEHCFGSVYVLFSLEPTGLRRYLSWRSQRFEVLPFRGSLGRPVLDQWRSQYCYIKAGFPQDEGILCSEKPIKIDQSESFTKPNFRLGDFLSTRFLFC